MTRFEGIFPALATPFTKDGAAIDFPSLEKLVEHVIAGGVHGVVVAGSTGEAATLSDEEYWQLIRRVQEIVGKRVAVIAGIGSNNTARAVAIAGELNLLGLDGLLVVTPPYNKPSQAGMAAHFRAIRGVSGIPLIAYNVPSRTGVNLLPDTMEELVADGTIVAVKESSGNMEQGLDLLSRVRKSASVLSGEDSLVFSFLAAGGAGTISTTANLAPKAFAQLWEAWRKGAVEESLSIQLRLLPLIRSIFNESNPIPLKYALSLQGIISHNVLRLPLQSACDETKRRLDRDIGLAL
jgi:4-hydroxy-tetrahydrodipicolinate synthase